MKVYENSKYQEDIRRIAGLPLPWDKLQGSSVLLSGATGLVGSCLVDVIMEKNASSRLCRFQRLSHQFAEHSQNGLRGI